MRVLVFIAFWGNEFIILSVIISGVTISDRNVGFNVTQFYSLGVSPTTNGMVGDNFVAGAQDNGSQMFLNATPGQNTSVEVQGGDGAFLTDFRAFFSSVAQDHFVELRAQHLPGLGHGIDVVAGVEIEGLRAFAVRLDKHHAVFFLEVRGLHPLHQAESFQGAEGEGNE